MTPEQKDKWDSLVAATEEWSKRNIGVENDVILAADAELKRLRTQRDALLGALRLAKELSELARTPNAEYFADKHNTALRRMLEALTSMEGAAAAEVMRKPINNV